MTARVLIVESSRVAREVLTRVLAADPEIAVVGAASDPYLARDLILRERPDVVVLDLEMPGHDALVFLQRLLRYHPLPVLLLASRRPRHPDLCLEALESGALDVVCKPEGKHTMARVAGELAELIRAVAGIRVVAPPRRPRQSVRRLSRSPHRMVALAAGTGGLPALTHILGTLPPDAPGLVIVQHLPAGYTRRLAARLAARCAVTVREACDGDRVTRGQALIAPGGKHVLLSRIGNQVLVRVKDGPPVGWRRPSVDVLFKSVARLAGQQAIGVLLSGLGPDGAAGLLELRERGAMTIVQDEASSAVPGLTRAALRLGAADQVLELARIPTMLLELSVVDPRGRSRRSTRRA